MALRHRGLDPESTGQGWVDSRVRGKDGVSPEPPVRPEPVEGWPSVIAKGAATWQSRSLTRSS